MRFSYELLTLSRKHRLYLLPRHYPLGATRFGSLEPTPLKRDSRWTFSYWSFAADCPLSRHLGFNRIPSNKIFSAFAAVTLRPIHPYVVALLALGVSSNSSGILDSSFATATYKFPYTLTIPPIHLMAEVTSVLGGLINRNNQSTLQLIPIPATGSLIV